MQKTNGTDILFMAMVAQTMTAVGGQRDCSLSLSGESIDVTAKDSGQWVERLVGRSDWSASGEAITMIDPDANALAPAVRELFLSIAEGTKMPVELSLPGNIRFSGRSVITSLELGNPDNDAATSSWECEADGPLELYEGDVLVGSTT